MPMYEYRCASCEQVTEMLRPMAAADDPVECESCGSAKTERIHSVFAATTGGGDAMAQAPPGCGRCGEMGGACPVN